MCDELSRLALLLEYERPFNTLVVDLIGDITSDLRRSDYEYAFAAPLFQSAHRHESLELRLLALHNKGYKHNGQSWVSPFHVSPTLSLASLSHTENRWKFCNHSLTISDGQLHLFFAIAEFPVSLRLPGAVPDSERQILPHTCISKHFYRDLPQDVAASGSDLPPDYEICDSCVVDLTGQEAGDDGDAAYGDPVATLDTLSLGDIPQRSFLPSSQAAQSPGDRRLSTRIRSGSPRQAGSLRRTATQPSFLVRALPPTLGWAVPYSPPSSESQYYPALACRLLRRFRDAAFEGAARNADATEQVSLDIPGTDTAHIALVYKDLIGQAVAAGDFSEILTRDRAFNVVHATSNDGPDTLSFGDGLEREVLTILAGQVVAALPMYFVSRLGDHGHSLSCPSVFPNSIERKQELGLLGAIISLCLMSGIAIKGIDGAWLVFVLNGCDFCSLDRSVMERFHPDLAKALIDLDSCGPNGDLAPFAHYLELFADIKIEQYVRRDAATHAALAPFLLFRALFGTEPPAEHSDTRALLKGLNLPCPNGWTMQKAARAFRGGPAALVSACYMTRITTYASLLPRLIIFVNSSVPASLDLPDLFKGFLQRTGVPAQPNFRERLADGVYKSALIPLDEMESNAGFRSIMFCIAATGGDSIMGDDLQVTFVGGEGDDAYACPPESRAFFAAQGVASWRTCFSKITIPTGYLECCVRRVYDSNSVAEAPSLVDDIDAWLLDGILSAIAATHGGIA
ncbi:hypothetical protein FOMPIDRAFT_86406 [Fomitopsis schrenkii]|uniref:HECT domain-containing protein n=1 Tax=Fomitopsis schrenkii TaxID=2126942 RepID=S8F0J2_FOMSC|nr:hypothetical protein FOMPIDRAFT_86406 [Fomitopsis schrenkii]